MPSSPNVGSLKERLARSECAGVHRHGVADQPPLTPLSLLLRLVRALLPVARCISAS